MTLLLQTRLLALVAPPLHAAAQLGVAADGNLATLGFRS
jgi:hypothetical protein